MLGLDDSRTLQCAQTVAAELRALQRLPAAIELGADTLTRRRRVLGDDHPDTIVSRRALRRDCLRILRELRCNRMTDDAMTIGLIPGLQALEHPIVTDAIAAAVHDQRPDHGHELYRPGTFDARV